jgi:hypothetical protein
MVDFFSMYTMLPFMLVLAIVYGSMETAGMFRNRALKTIIAVVVAFFAISNSYVVDTINSFLPYAALFFIAVFGFGFVKRSLGGQGRDNTLIIIIMALLLLLIASYSNSGVGIMGLSNYNDFLWFIGVIIIVAIFYAAFKTKAEP